MKALTSHKDGFTYLSRVLVVLLQTLLQDQIAEVTMLGNKRKFHLSKCKPLSWFLSCIMPVHDFVVSVDQDQAAQNVKGTFSVDQDEVAQKMQSAYSVSQDQSRLKG